MICAQLRLAKAARKQLIAIGIPEQSLPKLLAEPSHYSAFFAELFLHKKDGSVGEKISARPITPETVKTAIPLNSKIANNSSRHFWGSKCATSPMGLWLERTLLGHGRKLAVVGSWCTSVPPSVLIEQVHTFMRSTFDELKLDDYAGIKNVRLEFLEPAIQFKTMDRRKEQTNGSNRDMPLNYCNDTSLPAVAAVDILRDTLLQADSADANKKSLLSILTSDGITSPKDVRCIWCYVPI